MENNTRKIQFSVLPILFFPLTITSSLPVPSLLLCKSIAVRQMNCFGLFKTFPILTISNPSYFFSRKVLYRFNKSMPPQVKWNFNKKVNLFVERKHVITLWTPKQTTQLIKTQSKISFLLYFIQQFHSTCGIKWKSEKKIQQTSELPWQKS